MPLPTRRLAVALAGAAVLATAACTGGSAPTAASTAAGAESATVAALVRAAPVKASAQSMKFSFTSSTTLKDRTVALQGEGAFDPAERTGTVAFDVPGSSTSAGRIEERLIGDTVYLQLPQRNGVFFKVPLEQIVGTSLGNSTDPAAALSALLGVGQVSRTGTGSVRGMPTTVYEGTYRVQDALDAAQGLRRTFLASTLTGLAGTTAVPFTLQLDAQDRPVFFRQRLTLPAGLINTTTLEYFDYGSPVTVAAPPAAAVRDGAQLLAALKRLGAGASSPGASRAPSAAASAPASVPPPAPPAPSPSR